MSIRNSDNLLEAFCGQEIRSKSETELIYKTRTRAKLVQMCRAGQLVLAGQFVPYKRHGASWLLHSLLHFVHIINSRSTVDNKDVPFADRMVVFGRSRSCCIVFVSVWWSGNHGICILSSHFFLFFTSKDSCLKLVSRKISSNQNWLPVCFDQSSQIFYKSPLFRRNMKYVFDFIIIIKT